MILSLNTLSDPGAVAFLYLSTALCCQYGSYKVVDTFLLSTCLLSAHLQLFRQGCDLDRLRIYDLQLDCYVLPVRIAQ